MAGGLGEEIASFSRELQDMILGRTDMNTATTTRTHVHTYTCTHEQTVKTGMTE